MKCKEFLKDIDNHLKNLEITNFDMIYNKKTLSNDKIKQHQTIGYHKIMKYPIKETDQIMSSIFRNSKRDDKYVQTKTINEHLTIIQKVLVEFVSFRSSKMNITKRPPTRQQDVVATS